MTWDQARPLAESGQPIRRRSWGPVNGRYLFIQPYRGMWLAQYYQFIQETLMPATQQLCVVAAQFQMEEFLADDWTTLVAMQAEIDIPEEPPVSDEPFACETFDHRWWGEFGEWEQVGTIADDWTVPPGFEITKMCVRWVGMCNDADGNLIGSHVVGWRPGLVYQLLPEQYVDLAMPYRHPDPNASTVIALEFYGLRPWTGPKPRVCIGTVDKYNVWRKPL